MARKQLIRALPAEWAVQISQVSNGQEALAAIREGLGAILILDLTMPVMDGFQTLAALREEGLQSQVIVVSGDVQDEAVRRVMALGALAFVTKPADPVELRRVLIEHGLFQPSADSTGLTLAPRPELQLKVNFRDALREVANVAMGRAAALLAKVLHVFVRLPVPQVNILEVCELHMALQDAQRSEQFSAVCQGFIGDGIAGEALLLFHDSEVSDMADMLGWQPQNASEVSEMLLDLASIIIGACLSGLAEQLDVRFSQSHPLLLGEHASIDGLIKVNQTRWKKALAVEISYSLEGSGLHFDLLLLFTEDSIKRLTHKINYMMN